LIFYIRFFVFFYALYYSFEKKYFYQFIVFFFFFVVRISILIIRQNLLSIILGWEGLGISSYLLVTYYHSFLTLNISLITIFINRLGDGFFIISICLSTLYNILNLSKISIILLILARLVKRGQLPFRIWLPAAIAAPTPVSSLVHSSTLVTAGVYILIRFYYIINSKCLLIIYFIGLCTVLYSSTISFNEYRLKKIIAYSTLSQLGIIFVLIGFKCVNQTFYHLISHAYYKSILFIFAGTILNRSVRYADVRYFDNNFNNKPYVILILYVCNLCLFGFPFSSGFFRKECSLEYFISNYIYIFTWVLIFICILITTLYRIKLIVIINISYIVLKFSKMTKPFWFNCVICFFFFYTYSFY